MSTFQGIKACEQIVRLKNMGWSDKQEIESTVTVTGNPVIIFGDTSKKDDA